MKKYSIDEQNMVCMTFRVFPSVRNLIEEIVEKYQDRFDNESHFVRCAIVKYLETEFSIKQDVSIRNTKVI